MENIDIKEQRIADMSLDLLRILLSDKTTGKYIRWASDNYRQYGDEYNPEQEIRPELITGNNTYIIRPRIAKENLEQRQRTRSKAEVFTPSWICNLQNNLIDDKWFNSTGIFNTANGREWETNEFHVVFPKNRTWQQYVDLRRLEAACGEAPYLVSRYDTTTGRFLPVKERIGVLDRKIRVVNENVNDEAEWYKWITRAYQSTYGYEYLGDNVLLARENLLYTFVDNLEYKFNKIPTLMQIKKLATIIAWNIWQMDGMTYTAPYSESKTGYKQLTIDDILNHTEDKGLPVYCRIYDWRSKYSFEFREMVGNGNERKRV